MTIQGIKVLTVVCLLISVNYLQLSSHYITKIKKRLSKKCTAPQKLDTKLLGCFL